MKMKLLILAVLVLIGANIFNLQKAVAQEPDPNILWVADSSIGRIDGFAVHPNGNIFAYRNGSNDGLGQPVIELKVFEIDGNTGKLIRELPKFSDKYNIESIDISDDGKYLVTSFDGVIVMDLETGVSKSVGIGGRVSFIPNTNKITYRGIGGSTGHDSSVVILDLETEQRIYIRTEELLDRIAFSPDGRFFATGGYLYTGTSPSYSSLKLWDAKTNKLIKELERKENNNFTTTKIEFSPDNRLVAFKKIGEISVFDVNDFTEFKNYSLSNTSLSISGFSWIDKNNIGINSKFISVFRLSDDKRTDIYEFPEYFGRWLLTNTTKKILYSGTGYPDKGAIIIAFDLNKIFSNVQNKSENTIIQASYQKGTLTISGIQSVSNKVNIEIFDINGKLVSQLDLQLNGSEFTTPLKLPNGTYLMNLKDGNNVYSGKFLVVE
ncbi:MAG: T9SS type A sorting domain-containing protein [Candidatus Kapabacteria bacterium]|nr:T9SS type A sorting domain-containing protein [Candidatus Kapabacteria bacterium]